MQNYTFSSNFTTKIDIRQAKTATTHKITMLYIHGLFSDPWGRKPETCCQIAAEQNIDFIRFELIGHGSDSHHYEQADFHLWISQIEELITNFAQGDIIIAGSSLGGWLALLLAERHPDRVKGVIGLAAAPDFTMDLEQRIFTPEQKQQLSQTGRLDFTNHDFTYIFTKKMFDSARDFQLLNRHIDLHCPLHLLQGMKDASLDWRKALQIAQCVSQDDVTIKFLKGSNHRLGHDNDLLELRHTLEDLITKIRAQ